MFDWTQLAFTIIGGAVEPAILAYKLTAPGNKPLDGGFLNRNLAIHVVLGLMIAALWGWALLTSGVTLSPPLAIATGFSAPAAIQVALPKSPAGNTN